MFALELSKIQRSTGDQWKLIPVTEDSFGGSYLSVLHQTEYSLIIFSYEESKIIFVVALSLSPFSFRHSFFLLVFFSFCFCCMFSLSIRLFINNIIGVILFPVLIS